LVSGVPSAFVVEAVRLSVAEPDEVLVGEATAIENGARDAELVPSLTLITIFE
jgi:hypothetical protein